MKVLILLSVVALAFAELECGENSYYDDCASECPLTCDNYKTPPQVCILSCNPICYCDDGFVKTKEGICVKPEDCPIKPKPVGKNCLDAPERGNCKAYIPRFYYDVEHERCRFFIYGGCGGNGNSYASYGECMEQCGAAAAPHACQEEKIVGSCKASFKRFFFNTKTGQCEDFIYGGCDGNSNNFNSKEGCEAVCLA